jgi:hypothetical protein
MPNTWHALHSSSGPSQLEACQWLRDAAGREVLLLPVEPPWEGVTVGSAGSSAESSSSAPAGLHLVPPPGPGAAGVQLSADTQVGSRSWPIRMGLAMP